ncbi:alpha/beta hydrolase family protein [Alicyclobacillus fastidiosus]|uniref:Alpha/beta fold hydrolase n=1 Tax=Alicyclobacillus fastidiosus TaxID=392011 RepID=A0ABV5AKQ8_9BACL|nr:alpha/beta fold hydrolase [Alicyclobacillus fastidiosus]WEH08473.1 alpha/beta fold hydrolase [Alicyclobacillus fastidiosus]
MNLSKFITHTLLIYISIIATGCSTLQPAEKTTSSMKLSTSNRTTQPTTHQDGDLISLTAISVPHTNSGIETYKMIYWSHDTKTEAFLAAPKYAGMYPLLVSLHGGSAVALNRSHQTSPATSTTLQYASEGLITLVPEYRGYADSDGTIPNLQGEVSDVDNAIKALQGTVYSVEPDDIYLEGTSMGGAVALQLAAERNDIRSVIAVSPFTGWDIDGQWASKNKDTNTLASEDYNAILTNYGSYSAANPKLKSVSIDYQKIHVPTLLLQGTDDNSVAWQTVELLYDDMKRTNSNVKLDLIAGGNHGLKNKQVQVKQAIDAWYAKYGQGTSS